MKLQTYEPTNLQTYKPTNLQRPHTTILRVMVNCSMSRNFIFISHEIRNHRFPPGTVPESPSSTDWSGCQGENNVLSKRCIAIRCDTMIYDDIRLIHLHNTREKPKKPKKPKNKYENLRPKYLPLRSLPYPDCTCNALHSNHPPLHLTASYCTPRSICLSRS